MSREFTDNKDIKGVKLLSSEMWREYHFANGAVVRIDAPFQLHVNERGSHRVMTVDGISEYIPAGWVRLRWENYPQYAAFQF